MSLVAGNKTEGRVGQEGVRKVLGGFGYAVPARPLVGFEVFKSI